MVKSLQKLYRNSMRRHRFGYALYEPALFEHLRPGMVGYMDEYQRWHPIVDLTDTAAVEAGEYSPVGYLQPNGPDSRHWGPLAASNVVESSVELEAGVGATTLGLPIGVSGILKYGTTGGFGALLMCDGEVISEGFDFRNPFIVWLKRNAKVLFKRYPDLRKHGIYVATWTYSSENVHINVWGNGDHNVTVGFKVDVPQTVQAGPSTSWFRGRASSGWSAWTGQKRVVFFTGVKIKTCVLGIREQHEPAWRGSGQSFVVEGEEEGDDYEVDIQLVGDDWYDIGDI
ncbi:hypothetical protein F5Y10DRAFT_292800 [Nemania abortiva]|nr:hypothetical protein F5Y10DRAFT_292800 [Nemania abortiva]